MEVHQIMTKNPIYIGRNTTLREALRIMNESDFRHLPVVSEKELVGVISDRDLRTYTTPMSEDFDKQERAAAQLERTVAEIINGEAISVGPETDIGDAIDLMLDQKIGALPVIDDKDGTLVGIVSMVDIIREARPFFDDQRESLSP